MAEPIRFWTLNNVAAIPIEAELILVKVENCTATTVCPKQIPTINNKARRNHGLAVGPTRDRIYIRSIRSRLSNQLALLPQNPVTPAQLKVEELISYGRYPHRNNVNKLTKEDKESIEWAMDITKTLSFRNRQIANLSGGQRQKVWLAMALAQNTEILLLDEPTTYLDMAHQLEVLQIVEKLNKEQKITTVMVLHYINYASRFSHEIITMKEGEIVKIGTPGEIITPAVLEEVFRIHARVMIDPANWAPVCFGYDNLSQQEVYKEAVLSN